jgi:hypothetical protein
MVSLHASMVGSPSGRLGYIHTDIHRLVHQAVALITSIAFIHGGSSH